MSSITLACKVDRVTSKTKGRVVLKKITKKVYEMVTCIARIINLLRVVIVRKTDTNRLIYKHQVSKIVPTPWVFYGGLGAFATFNVHWTYFIEATKLTGFSRASLKPNDKGRGFITPIFVIPLPERIVYGCRALRKIPVHILIPSKVLT